MEKKISISTCLLFIAILVIAVMGAYIYKLKNTITNTNNAIFESNKEHQEEVNNSDELFTIKDINMSSSDYEEHQAENDRDVLYNFRTHEWVNMVNETYYLAVDGEKNLYIVDPTEEVIAKLDAKLENMDSYFYSTNEGENTNFKIDNYITYARVSKKQNTLEIQTAEDFITFIVNLDDYSTKLAEINDY